MSEQNINYQIFSDEKTVLDLDIQTEVRFLKRDHPEGKMVPVSIDGKEEFILVPLNIKDGDTIKVSGRGKHNPRSGKTGDLYVLVHIEERTIPWKKLTMPVVLVAVIVATFIIFQINKADSAKVGQEPSESVQLRLPEETNCANADHRWIPATCTDAQYCEVCGETVGEPLGHDWAEATYVAPKTCRRCNIEDGQPLAQFQMIVEAGAYHSCLLRPDGTVYAVGCADNDRCKIGDWTDIVQISASSHTVGLRKDGTVLATGPNEKDGRCDVHNWSGITQVFAGFKNTIALRENGTAVIIGDNSFGQCNGVSQWTDLISVCVGEATAFGLKTDGTVVACSDKAYPRDRVASWSNIKQISSVYSHIVGLREDGTVVAAGNNKFGQCDVENWTDVVAVSAGYSHTVGLKADGTVLCTGNNGSGQCDARFWTDMQWVSAGQNHTIGMKKDGTILAVGSNAWKQCDITD